jgi:hypothetical protein
MVPAWKPKLSSPKDTDAIATELFCNEVPTAAEHGGLVRHHSAATACSHHPIRLNGPYKAKAQHFRSSLTKHQPKSHDTR